MRQVASKWKKYEVLNKHSGVSVHLPATIKFTENGLKEMLSRFSFVVAKPIVGAGGLGVVKIESNGKGKYHLHHHTTYRENLSWRTLIREINRIRRGRAYMIQQGIRLSRVNGRNVDYRVKLVKQGKHWRVTAVVARLSRPKLFVTNLSRGGTMMKGGLALRRTFPRYARAKKATMIGVARTCTHLLEKQFPGLQALGYDFGIDRKGDVWLFEVNTRPQ